MMKTVLVDDHHIFLEGLQFLLEQTQLVEIIGKCTDVVSAIEFVKRNAPDLVITDLNMPEMNGNLLIEKLRAAQPELPIIVLSMHMDIVTIRQTIQQNVNAYLFKDSDSDQLKFAINAIQKGKKFFDSRVSSALVEHMEQENTSERSRTYNYKLTEREKEILTLLTREYTQSEIADQLKISPNTVVYHKRKLMSIFDVKSTAGLIRYATELGLG